MTNRKKIRIVVVDDSQTARELLVGLYESAGMQVVGVGKTGEDAIKLAAAHKPDVISMDVFMPKMDGLTATRAINYVDVPVFEQAAPPIARVAPVAPVAPVAAVAAVITFWKIRAG